MNRFGDVDPLKFTKHGLPFSLTQRWHSVEPGSVNAVPETEPNDNIAIPIRKLRECM